LAGRDGRDGEDAEADQEQPDVEADRQGPGGGGVVLEDEAHRGGQQEQEREEGREPGAAFMGETFPWTDRTVTRSVRVG
jgi:hypothetical protein